MTRTLSKLDSFGRRSAFVEVIRRGLPRPVVSASRQVFWAVLLAMGLVLTVAIGLSLQRQGLAGWSVSQPAVEAAAADRPLYNIDDAGQLMRSDDGTNWMPIAGLLSRATALEATSEVLYVGTESAGLFKSADGGATWQPISQGLGPVPNVTITAMAVDPADVDRVAVATGYWFGTSEVHFAPMDVFASEDGGATWHSISGGPVEKMVERLSLDALNPGTVEAHLSDGTVIVLNR